MAPIAKRVRSNRVCFTYNNYEVEDTITILDRLEGHGRTIKYAIVGEEIGEQGTPHLQGFVHVDLPPKECGIKYWKEILGLGQGVHLENAKGTDQQNFEYCSKSGPYMEIGSPAEIEDSDWARIYKACKEGNLEKALDVDPEKSVKYIHQIRTFCNLYIDPKFDNLLENLYGWQKTVIEKLENQCDRKVLFVVDEEGGKGKSALTKHILSSKKAWPCQGIS